MPHVEAGIVAKAPHGQFCADYNGPEYAKNPFHGRNAKSASLLFRHFPQRAEDLDTKYQGEMTIIFSLSF